MNRLTDSAQRLLDDFFQRTRDRLRSSGADAEEVVEDLRLHIDEEIRNLGMAVVTEEDLRRILTKLGEPGIPDAPTHPAGSGSWFWQAFTFVFGVLLPLGTLTFEHLVGASASDLFDPIPTWFHSLAILLVPGMNLWMWRVAQTGKCRQPKLLGGLSAAAIGIAAYYALLYLPFSPFAVIGIIVFGLGLVPLAPLISLILGISLRSRAGKSLAPAALGRFWPAFAAGFIVMCLTQLPGLLTYNGLAKAASDEPAVKRAGIAQLRAFGSEDILLRECYGRWRQGNMDIPRMLASGTETVPAHKVREIYYRVMGRPFNAVPAPTYNTRRGAWNDEFAWDGDLGGAQVAGHVRGLSLLSSRLDAVAEPDAAVTYCEWTMEFKNMSTQPREARAQIALPPGGVVSRVTLWINGEEREAAFGGRSQVREAYQEVAVIQRRDPVLVTTCGPDRVLMQCFPVPTNGGTMKIRLGITAPLTELSPQGGRFVWPQFLERNFKIVPEFKHAAWIQSSDRLKPMNGELAYSQADDHSLRGSRGEGALGSVWVTRNPAVTEAWTPALEPGQIIRQQLTNLITLAPAKIAFVIDGSAGLGDLHYALAGLIAAGTAAADISVVIAGDEPAWLNELPSRHSSGYQWAMDRRLSRYSFRGGQDNLPALEQAWDRVCMEDRGIVVWIHDPQPMLLSSTDSLRQRLEHNNRHAIIVDLPLHPGPNRIAENLEGFKGFVTGPSYLNTEDQGAWIKSLAAGDPAYHWVRESLAAAPEAQTGAQVSRHIERLWAVEQAKELAKHQSASEAAALAAKHQLVTRWSGAVVLETKAQYDRHGLKPADPKVVPVVTPEPSTWALLIVGMAVLMFWLRKQKRPGAAA